MRAEALLSLFQISGALRRLAAYLAAEKLELELSLCFGRVMLTLRRIPAGRRGTLTGLAPTQRARELAWVVAMEQHLDVNWLEGEGTKFFLTHFTARNRADYDRFSPGVRLAPGEPRRLLAMRLHELNWGGSREAVEDVRFLLERMKLTASEAAKAVYPSFFPGDGLKPAIMTLMAARQTAEPQSRPSLP